VLVELYKGLKTGIITIFFTMISKIKESFPIKCILYFTNHCKTIFRKQMYIFNRL